LLRRTEQRNKEDKNRFLLLDKDSLWIYQAKKKTFSFPETEKDIDICFNVSHSVISVNCVSIDSLKTHFFAKKKSDFLKTRKVVSDFRTISILFFIVLTEQ
jgi:hypothetical protein